MSARCSRRTVRRRLASSVDRPPWTVHTSSGTSCSACETPVSLWRGMQRQFIRAAPRLARRPRRPCKLLKPGDSTAVVASASGRAGPGRCPFGTPPLAWRSLVQFRSLHSLARRTPAVGGRLGARPDLFNAVQPTLRPHRIGPGTVKDVPLTLVPTAAGHAATGNGAAGAGAVDNRKHAPSGSATLPRREAESGAGSLQAAPAPRPACGQCGQGRRSGHLPMDAVAAPRPGGPGGCRAPRRRAAWRGGGTRRW
jgi:hypothetical protein